MRKRLHEMFKFWTRQRRLTGHVSFSGWLKDIGSDYLFDKNDIEKYELVARTDLYGIYAPTGEWIEGKLPCKGTRSCG